MHPQIIKTSRTTDQEELVYKVLAQHSYDTYHQEHIKPSGRYITIDQVRDLRKTLNVAGQEKAIVFYSFDSATTEAQNALLKVLEEQSDRHAFFLLTAKVDAVLSTIRSRCVLTKDQSFLESKEVDENVAKAIAQVRENKSATALSFDVFQPSSREDAESLLNQIIIHLRKELQAGDRWSYKLIKKAFYLQNLLLKNNLNPQLAVDMWLIKALYS